MNDSTELLLQTDMDSETLEYCKKSQDQISSGYNSTDGSDSETDWSLEPARGIPTIPLNLNTEQSVCARVKSMHVLCEDLKLILDMPDMCDVTFVVGPHEVPVHGVRAILGTRSKVLYQLILQHLNQRRSEIHQRPSLKSTSPLISDRLTIPVRKYDPEVFRMIVQFIHCGSALITDDSVCGLLCGADQFELFDLEAACWQYIECRVPSVGCQQMLNGALRYRCHRKSQEVIDQIRNILHKQHVQSLVKESTV